jgi:hypothetical protein
LRGILTLSAPTRLLAGVVAWPCQGDRYGPRLNRSAGVDAAGSLATLGPPGEAESGSAGVQPDKEYPGRRCADGASDLWGIKTSRGLFCRHRTPESCLENAPASSRRLRFGLRSDSIAFSLVGGRSSRPCTYWGLSQGRSMKIIERSYKSEQVHSFPGNSANAGPKRSKELRSAR